MNETEHLRLKEALDSAVAEAEAAARKHSASAAAYYAHRSNGTAYDDATVAFAAAAAKLQVARAAYETVEAAPAAEKGEA